MGAHGDGSMERNRQPTILDDSALASGLVSSGLPVARGVASSRQAPSTQSVSWLAKENQLRRLLK